MSQQPTNSERLPRAKRVVLAIVGLGLLVPLVVAMLLQPSETGMATHRQLGLPPCTFVMLFGIRCPSCGMTTSWAHLMRGQLASAMASNAGGTLLGLSAMAAIPWLWFAAAKGRWWFRVRSEWLLAGLIVVFVVTLVDWAYRLTR
jgi:hypothetical protein